MVTVTTEVEVRATGEAVTESAHAGLGTRGSSRSRSRGHKRRRKSDGRQELLNSTRGIENESQGVCRDQTVEDR